MDFLLSNSILSRAVFEKGEAGIVALFDSLLNFRVGNYTHGIRMDRSCSLGSSREIKKIDEEKVGCLTFEKLNWEREKIK